MAANDTGWLGREIGFKWGPAGGALVAIPGVKQKGIARNGSAIDVSSDEDGGWRTLLNKPGQRELNISLAGVTKDSLLRATIGGADGDVFGDFEITYPDGGRITGSAMLLNYDETGSFETATTWSGALQSTGAVTYLPPA